MCVCMCVPVMGEKPMVKHLNVLKWSVTQSDFKSKEKMCFILERKDFFQLNLFRSLIC